MAGNPVSAIQPAASTKCVSKSDIWPEEIAESSDLWPELAILWKDYRRIAQYLWNEENVNSHWLKVIVDVLAGKHWKWVGEVQHRSKGRPVKASRSCDDVRTEIMAFLASGELDAVRDAADMFDPLGQSDYRVVFLGREHDAHRPARPVRRDIKASMIHVMVNELVAGGCGRDAAVATVAERQKITRATVYDALAEIRGKIIES
jgi:hypothetical protein